MKTHIKLTLEEIQSDIDSLTRTKDSLENLYGGDAAEPAPEPRKKTVPRKPRAVQPAASAAPKPAPVAAAEGDQGPIRVGSFQEAVLIQCRKQPEPFTCESVAVAMGKEKKDVGNAMLILTKKGLIEQCGKEGVTNLYKMN